MPIETLAQDIGRIARIDGDHSTAIPQLSLHRRSGKTDPMPCIYGLGLAVVAQGGKQVTVGEQVLDYGMGQSLLITADLPVVAHVTRADLARPFMCLFLALDARALMQQSAEMELPPVPRDEAPRAYQDIDGRHRDVASAYSLRRDGLEPGVNDRARERAIVIHAADYVNPLWSKRQGRIGRSQGCPAVRPEIARRVIDKLKGGQFMYSWYPDRSLVKASPYLNCQPRQVARILAANGG